MLTLEVFSDYACPYCYISKKQIEHLLDAMGVEYRFKHRSYQLEPFAEEGVEVNFLESLKKEKTPEELEKIKRTFDKIESLAKTQGLDYDMEHLKRANTDAAHRLTYFAETYGKDDLLCDALFHGQFCESANLNDFDYLVSVAEKVGLDKDEARKVLESDAYGDAIEEDTDEGFERSIQLIPHYLLPNGEEISGVPAEAILKEKLQSAIESLS